MSGPLKSDIGKCLLNPLGNKNYIVRHVSTMLGQPQSQGDCPPGTRFYYGDGVTGYNICQDR